MKQRHVNFIVTCFDKEDFWPYLYALINSYKFIIPHIAFCYNGQNENLDADFRCENRGLYLGDVDLIAGGYELLRHNGVRNFIKLSVDSWLCDEQKIHDIFDHMEKHGVQYAGSEWDTRDNFSTDVFFVRECGQNIIGRFVDLCLERCPTSIPENCMAKVALDSGQWWLFDERRVIGLNQHRTEVPELKWTMWHDLQKNIDNLKKWTMQEKIDVNFIVTCFDRESYWAYLREIISSYKTIVPHIVFCYSGNDTDFPCDIRLNNNYIRSEDPKQLGDGNLICGGYQKLKNNKVDKWIKLSVDTWPCDESVLINLLNRLDAGPYHYVGCRWKSEESFATDLIIADSFFMQSFVENFQYGDKNLILEKYCYNTAMKTGRFYLIPERQVWDDETRFSLPALGLTMEHDLQKNIEFMKQFNHTGGPNGNPT